MSAAVSPPKGLSRWEALLLGLLAIVPFLNGLPADFTYDDKLIIRDDERIAEPSRIGQVFSTQYFGGSLKSAQNYRPVVLLTYAVQRWVHGNRPALFRCVNIAIHAAATLALASWLLAVGFEHAPTLAVASLFAVVTIHVEAVTSLVGRAEVLAALLVLLAARLWLRATEGGRLRAGLYAAVLVLFFVAVFVKENAVILPGVILLGELFRGGAWLGPAAFFRHSPGRVRLAFLGFALPLAGLFAVRRIVLKGFLLSSEAEIWDLENPLVELSVPLRVGNALTLMLRYIAKTLIPVGLSADHSANAISLGAGFGDLRAWAGAALLGVALIAGFLLRKSQPPVLFGLLLFLGAFFPASNIPFPVGTIFAERLMYLPAAGLFLALAGVLAPQKLEVPRPSRWPWRETLLVLAVLSFGTATALRNLVWRDDHALFADMVAKVPGSAKAHYNLAYDAGRRGEKALQRRHLTIAVDIFPSYYDAWAALGRVAWDEKRWDEAITCYRRSVELFPEYENGRWGLAKTLEESGRKAEAAAAWDEAARLLPDSYPVAWHRAEFLESQGRLDEAAAEWRRAIPLGSGAASAHLSLARLLGRRARAGDEKEAWREARRALVANPADAEARLFLAERFAARGKAP